MTGDLAKEWRWYKGSLNPNDLVGRRVGITNIRADFLLFTLQEGRTRYDVLYHGIPKDCVMIDAWMSVDDLHSNSTLNIVIEGDCLDIFSDVDVPPIYFSPQVIRREKRGLKNARRNVPQS